MASFNINLIDNNFTIEEAREVLHRLTDDKINFLNLKILSDKERLGVSDGNSEKRIAELKKDQQHILNSLSLQDGEGFYAEIECKIAVKIKEKKTVA